MKTLAVVVFVLALSAASFPRPSHCLLQRGFYRGQCGATDVEAIIRDVVARRLDQDSSIVAALLRLQFHDCFVQGCDASLLLEGPSTEKTAGPNFSVRGYELIDEAKEELEKACPGVVSCADIIVAATRDAVAMNGGPRYEIRTGRMDGLVSERSKVDLPGPSISVTDAIAYFESRGFTAKEMVVLLGGHSVGTTECRFVQNRLYNYNQTGQRDPNMDPILASSLAVTCPENGNAHERLDLEQNRLSSSTVDNEYYRQLLLKRGVLEIDQALAIDERTRRIVRSLAFGFDFRQRFAKAMVKMGEVEVLAANGEIRRNCRAVNSAI